MLVPPIFEFSRQKSSLIVMSNVFWKFKIKKHVKQRRNYPINIANFFASNLNFLLLLDNIPSLNRLNRPGYRGRRFTRTLAMEWGHLGGPAPTIIYGECVCNPPTWLTRVVLILHIFAILKSNNTKIVVASLLYLLWKWQMVGRRRLLQHSVCKSLNLFHLVSLCLVISNMSLTSMASEAVIWYVLFWGSKGHLRELLFEAFCTQKLLNNLRSDLRGHRGQKWQSSLF